VVGLLMVWLGKFASSLDVPEATESEPVVVSARNQNPTPRAKRHDVVQTNHSGGGSSALASALFVPDWRS
jgi:hypothetical protein